MGKPEVPSVMTNEQRIAYNRGKTEYDSNRPVEQRNPYSIEAEPEFYYYWELGWAYANHEHFFGDE